MSIIENTRQTKLASEIATDIVKFTNGDTDFPRSEVVNSLCYAKSPMATADLGGEGQEGFAIEELYQNLIQQGMTKVLRNYVTEVGKELKQGEDRTLRVLDRMDLYADLFYPEELAYKLGEGTSVNYISIHRVEDGYDYYVVNSHWGEIDGGVYDDTSITIYEAVHEIVFDEYDPLLPDSKNMTEVDFEALQERVDDVAMGNLQQVIDDKKYTVGVAFGDDSEVFSLDMRDLFLQDENSFLQTPDSFGIYQIKNGDEFREKRFTNIKHLKMAGEEVEKESYDFVYFAPLDTLQTNDFENKNSLLNQVFYIFNTDLPERYQGHSVSVSDVIALNRGGEVSCHFVDSFGFQEVKNFIDLQAHAVKRENKSEQAIMKDILKSLTKENERKQQGTQKKNLHDER